MRNDPEQFVNLALDTCDKQKSKVIKTQGAKLLEAMCDNIDGAVSFVTLFCCQSLHLALNKTKGDRVASIQAVSETFYPAEYSQLSTGLFLQSAPEIIAETCLVALTAISYVLPRREDLVPVFEEVLADNIDAILGLGHTSNQGIILMRARMSLLLGYYADMLFKKYEPAFLKVVDFLITSVALTGEQKVVALQSADTLSTIVSDVDLVPRLEPHLPRLLEVMNT